MYPIQLCVWFCAHFIEFYVIPQIAYRLLELYGQLKDLGNPLYFKDTVEPLCFKGTVEPLPCGIDRTSADARVRETEVNLESWKKRVTALRSQYDWLLFFSIPKILRLYKLVSLCGERNEQLDKIVDEIKFQSKSDETTRHRLFSVSEERHEQLDEIVAEISFLCKNDQTTRNDLKQRVKVGVHA